MIPEGRRPQDLIEPLSFTHRDLSGLSNSSLAVLLHEVRLNIDWLLSIADLLGTKFLIDDTVVPGPYCMFEGIILRSADLATTVWTFAVRVNTFLLIAGGKNVHEWVERKSSEGKGRWFVVGRIWLFVAFIGLFGIIFIQPFHPEPGNYCISSEGLSINCR